MCLSVCAQMSSELFEELVIYGDSVPLNKHVSVYRISSSIRSPFIHYEWLPGKHVAKHGFDNTINSTPDRIHAEPIKRSFRRNALERLFGAAPKFKPNWPNESSVGIHAYWRPGSIVLSELILLADYRDFLGCDYCKYHVVFREVRLTVGEYLRCLRQYNIDIPKCICDHYRLNPHIIPDPEAFNLCTVHKTNAIPSDLRKMVEEVRDNSNAHSTSPDLVPSTTKVNTAAQVAASRQQLANALSQYAYTKSPFMSKYDKTGLHQQLQNSCADALKKLSIASEDVSVKQSATVEVEDD